MRTTTAEAGDDATRVALELRFVTALATCTGPSNTDGDASHEGNRRPATRRCMTWGAISDR